MCDVSSFTLLLLIILSQCQPCHKLTSQCFISLSVDSGCLYFGLSLTIQVYFPKMHSLFLDKNLVFFFFPYFNQLYLKISISNYLLYTLFCLNIIFIFIFLLFLTLFKILRVHFRNNNLYCWK